MTPSISENLHQEVTRPIPDLWLILEPVHALDKDSDPDHPNQLRQIAPQFRTEGGQTVQYALLSS